MATHKQKAQAQVTGLRRAASKARQEGKTSTAGRLEALADKTQARIRAAYRDR